jgi:hypothetical protein
MLQEEKKENDFCVAYANGKYKCTLCRVLLPAYDIYAKHVKTELHKRAE